MQARLDEEEFGELDDEPAAAAAEETKAEDGPTNVNSMANVTTAPAASSSYPSAVPTERKKSARKTAVKADTIPHPADMSKTDVAPIPVAATEAKKSAEPTDKTENAVVVALKPPTSAKEQASEEMKRKRAERFNIPVVSSNPPKEKELGKKGSKEPTSKRKKTEKAEEPKVLPLEEIEKLLQRAEKYGSADKARIDELKAMKRTYRFS